MSTLFLSHSHHDGPAALQLKDWLVSQGFHALFLDCDPQAGIAGGVPWEKELHRQLRRCDAVLALCSEQFTGSRWCFAEVTYAKAMGKGIIPVQLDASPKHELLRDIQAVDFSGSTQTSDEANLALLRALSRLGLRGHDGGAWSGERAPYPGLTAFEEEDAPVFFGREAEVASALADLRKLRLPDAPRCLIMLGASGCGKSSLLRAGLLPKLRADTRDWIVIDAFRPGAKPLTRLAQSLAACFERAGKSIDWLELRATLLRGEPAACFDLGDDLRYILKASAAGVMLVVDQLEEALLPRETEIDEAAQFLRLVCSWTASDVTESPFWLIGTLRSDFLGLLQTHPDAQGLQFETSLLGPMPATGLERVIRGPAELSGIELEAGLVELMVRDTATSDALPLLAFALRELYENHGEDRLLTLDEYREPPPTGIGGLQGAVAQAAEDVLLRQKPPLDAQRLQTLRDCFLGMVVMTERGEPARRPARWEDLPSSAHPLLEQFVQARLLLSREVGGARELEVAHEALFRSWDRLKRWLDQAARFLAWRKELERAMVKAREPEREQAATPTLLRGDDLVHAAANFKQYGELLTTQERAFIRRSMGADRRRRWLVRSLVIGVIVVLAGAAWFARKQSLLANERGNSAKRATLIAAARGFPEDATRASALLRETTEPANTVKPTARILEGHTAAVRCLAYSPDDTRIVTGSDDHTARIWNTRDSLSASEPRVLRGHTEAVRFAVFDPTGTRVLTASDDRTARVWTLAGDGEPLVLKSQSIIENAAFSPDGKFAVTVGQSGPSGGPFDAWGERTPDSIQIWDLATGLPVKTIADKLRIIAARISEDGSLVAVASENKTLRIWSTTEPTRPSIELSESLDQATVLAFSRDRTMLAAGTQLGQVYWWQLQRGSLLRADWDRREPITSLAFAADSLRLFAGSADGSVRFWTMFDLELARESRVFTGHRAAVTALALSPDGNRLASASSDRAARLWNTDGTYTHPLENVVAPGLDSLTKTLGPTYTRTLQYQLLQDLQQQAHDQLGVLAGHDARLTAVAWSHDGGQVATASADSTVRLWRTDERPQPITFSYPAGTISSLALSPDGERVLIGLVETAQLRNADGTGDAVALEGLTGPVTRAIFSDDARILMTGSNDGSVRLWDVTGARPKTLVVLANPGDPVHALAFQPNGKAIAALSGSELRVWNAADPKHPVETGHTRAYEFSYTRDGKSLLTSEGTSMRVWTADASKLLRPLYPSGIDPLRSSHFRLTADGQHVVTCLKSTDAERTISYELWSLEGDSRGPRTLDGYKYDAAVDRIWSDSGQPWSFEQIGGRTGDPCERDDGSSFLVRSQNGRRMAFGSDFGAKAGSGNTTVAIVTVDARTQLWRTVDHCISAKSRTALLGETPAEADRGVRCCRSTLALCRNSSFDTCAETVTERYANLLLPCAHSGL